jgi:hypothetical protein
MYKLSKLFWVSFILLYLTPSKLWAQEKKPQNLAHFYYTPFSTEIKMFHGLRNLLVKDDSIYSGTLNKLYSKY